MNWVLFNPELYFLAIGVVFVFVSLVKRPDARQTYYLALVLAALGVGVCVAGVGLKGDLFFETYRVDLFSQVFKAILAMGYFLVVCLCADLSGVRRAFRIELYLLLTFCTLAMMMLVSCVHLLPLYVALELSSYSLYILVFLRSDQKWGASASLRYFINGALASAMMLMGLALIYGATRAAYIIDLMRILPGAMDQPVVTVGLLFTLCGFFFKLAVFPFHFWAPDAYAGAPNQVAAYISTVSKAAAVAVLVRMVALSGGAGEQLAHALIALSIVSMTVGNIAAIVQKDLKRLLAFSSIAHAGYVLIGIVSMSSAGYSGAIFYAFSVLLMKFTCFLVVVKVAEDGDNINVEQLAGLHQRSPLLAMALMLALFGLAGIPPTIGFTGKLLVFTAAVERGYFFLVLIAMFNVVISLYYYLLVLKAAYLLEPPSDQNPLRVSTYTKLLTGAMVAAMVVLGFYPTYLIAITQAATRVLF